MLRNYMPLLALGLGFVLAGVALADGVILNGLSARSIGRGGTNLASNDNGAILYDNPAGAVNIDGQRMFDLGVDFLLTDFRYTDPLNDVTDGGVFPLPQVGFIRKTDDERFAYGVGVFVPAGFSESYDLLSPVFGPQHYKSWGSLAKVLPTLAYRVNDRLSVGGTLGVAITHAELKGPYFLQSPGPLQGVPTVLDLAADGAALCWSVGTQYELTDTTTLGLAYQSESRFQLRGPTDVTVPFVGQTHYDTEMDITWPQSLGLGVRHELCPHRILSTDVIWFGWSSAFDSLGLQLRNPRIPAFPPVDEQFPLRWSDTVSVRVGFEQLLDRGRTLRCGYVYHRNPIPTGTLTPYIQAIGEHSFSAGYGFMARDWNIDLAYMFNFGREQTVAQSDLLGGQFNDSVHQSFTHAVALSFMRQRKPLACCDLEQNHD